jgi:hypothetical protein
MMNSGGILVELSHSGLIPADSGNSGLIPADSGPIPADSGAIPPESVGHQKVQGHLFQTGSSLKQAPSLKVLQSMKCTP